MCPPRHGIYSPSTKSLPLATDQILAAAGEGGPFDELQVGPPGVVFSAQGSDSSFNACGGDLHSDFGTGLIYSDCGTAANPTTGVTVGNFNAAGLVAPDSTLNRVFIFGQTLALVQQRQKRISKAEIVRMMHARRGAERR